MRVHSHIRALWPSRRRTCAAGAHCVPPRRFRRRACLLRPRAGCGAYACAMATVCSSLTTSASSTSGSTIFIPISQGKGFAVQSLSRASKWRLLCTRTNLSTFCWPNLFLFLLCIHPSIDQACSQPEAEQVSAVSLIAAHCMAGQWYKYARVHSKGGIAQASLEKASVLVRSCVSLWQALFVAHPTV